MYAAINSAPARSHFKRIALNRCIEYDLQHSPEITTVKFWDNKT